MPDPVLFAKAVIAAALAGAGVTLAIAFAGAALLRMIRRTAPVASASLVGIAGVLGTALGAALGIYILGDLPPRSLEGEFPHLSISNVLDRILVVVLPLVILVDLVGGFSITPRW